MPEAHRDELESLQAFLIREHELTVLSPSERPATLLAAAAAAKPTPVSLTSDSKSCTCLKFRVTPSDDSSEDDPPPFYLWLHIGWSAAYPASPTEYAVIDLDHEHNTDYLDGSARRELAQAMMDEVKTSSLGDGGPQTLSMLTVLRDRLAAIPVKDRVKKSLFDTIGKKSSSAAATGTATGTASSSNADNKHSTAAPGGTTTTPAPASAPATSSATAAQTITQPKAAELNKKQKRRMAKHLDEKGEKKRGWNWVDLVSHVRRCLFVVCHVCLLQSFVRYSSPHTLRHCVLCFFCTAEQNCQHITPALDWLRKLLFVLTSSLVSCVYERSLLILLSLMKHFFLIFHTICHGEVEHQLNFTSRSVL